MRKKFAALAASSILVLAACGSDGSSSSDGGDGASTTTAAPAESVTGTVVQVALGTPGFETLVAAVLAAGLSTTLSGEGPFTVFAPTNAAFEALPAGLLGKLLEPKNKAVLAKILAYHVVPGKVMSADLKAGKIATVEGSDITVSTSGGLKVNQATIAAADVEATNGVIHVIDAIILPPGLDPSGL